MNRHASIWVLSFFLVTDCGVVCQNPPSTDLLPGLQLDGPNPSDTQRPEMRAWKSLPDAPSPIQPPAQAEGFHTFGNDSAGVLPGFCPSNCGYGYLPRKSPDFQTPLDKERLNETEGGHVTPGSRHAPSERGSLISGASSAASSNFTAPDGSGKRKVDPPDFLGTVTSFATRAAYRIGRDPLLRLSKRLVLPLAKRGFTPSPHLGPASGKK